MMDGEVEKEWDPFALEGYADEDEQVGVRKVDLRDAKPVRQGSLFQFALEAIERRKGDGKPA